MSKKELTPEQKEQKRLESQFNRRFAGFKKNIEKPNNRQGFALYAIAINIPKRPSKNTITKTIF